MIKINNITSDDLKRAIHTADLINRPLIIFALPYVIKTLKEQIPDIEEMAVLQEVDYVEPDKAIIMNREKLDKWTTGNLDDPRSKLF